MNKTGKEIERKWLLDGELPETALKLLNTEMIYQGYMSINPEIRIRTSELSDSSLKSVFTVKGEGDLVRDEVQFEITRDQFDTMLRIAGFSKEDLIHKRLSVYDYNGYKLEVNYVDAGKETAFNYMEIEFNSIEDAKNFVAPEWFGREITYEPQYKMKNYWQATRLNKAGE